MTGTAGPASYAFLRRALPQTLSLREKNTPATKKKPVPLSPGKFSGGTPVAFLWVADRAKTHMDVLAEPPSEFRVALLGLFNQTRRRLDPEGLPADRTQKGEIPSEARTNVENPSMFGEGNVEPLRNPAGAVLVPFYEFLCPCVISGKGLIVQGHPRN